MGMHKSGIVNRKIGVKNFIRVVILDPQTKGHVRNPKIAMSVMYSQKCDMILQVRRIKPFGSVSSHFKEDIALRFCCRDLGMLD